MKKTLIALALVAITAPIAVQATQSNGIGYTYVQLDYVNVSQSGHGAVSNGAMLSGSYGFADNFQVFGSYADQSFNRSFLDVDSNIYGASAKVQPWTLGFGYAASIGSRADWVTQLSDTYSRYSFHGCTNGYGCESFRDSNNTWAINTGVMGRVTDSLTANAYVGYGNGGKNINGNIFADFGLVYSINPMWAIHGGVNVNNDSSETFSLGVRASF